MSNTIVVNVDFTQDDDVPTGELLLEIHKVEHTVSTAGNRMLKMQFKIIEDPQNLYEGRLLFDNWMLEPDNATFRYKGGMRAFTNKGEFDVYTDGQLDLDKMLGLRTWARVVAEEGKGDYEGVISARIKKYGITPKALLDSGADEMFSQ